MTPFPSHRTFEKWHGLRNDFILVHAQSFGPDEDFGALARQLCDRREGVGADGLLVLGPPDAPSMTVYNADGSRPQMCGNGLRCAAAWYTQSAGDAPEVEVQTDAGVRTCRVQNESDDRFLVEVDMGTLRFGWKGGAERVSDEALGEGWVVDAGNPHWIFLRDQPDRSALADHGARMEVDPRFPERTNVEMAAPLDADARRWRVDVWERGCGFTEACGTGACAVAGALVRTGRRAPEEEIEIELPGGPLAIAVSANFRARMRGPAQRVYCGTLAPCAADSARGAGCSLG